ncbi:MAG TPA: class I tRNA ligase family protein, partial [Pirellulaceae bacterium]|nr:class I tRNA ligase family protein [Pirellulaceae bacterium]
MNPSADDYPNRFDFAEAQPRLYKYWQEHGWFHADPTSSKPPFTIVIPPPNVTGALHLGHALNNSLQDILIRFRRMQGFETLWMPGTDHAGIATQAVVEKRLKEEEGKTRHDLGREALVERIWRWKDEYEKRILGQLARMGASCDWERTRFTLDETCARAVRATFFDLFAKELIYRGKRLVNWDTFLQTAVSDDEVFQETVKGHFWHLRYPVIDPRPGEPTEVIVATTRPETLLGDTAVAVHPDPAAAFDAVRVDLEERLAKSNEKDRAALRQELEALAERRSAMLPQLELLARMARDGRQVRLPLLGRAIPLVTDGWAKPELGSGCVKITPAHDPNDYEVGKRQQLPMINILNADGTLNAAAGPYEGLSIRDARKRVVADVETAGLLERVEDREIELPHSDRSKTPIEPYLADQWFVRMDSLAQSAMDAVTDGRVTIHPPRYAKGYLDWLGEKRDWPVSRQLWWGHRIPVWSRTWSDDLAREQAAAAREEIVRVLDGLPGIAVQSEASDEGERQVVHVCVRDEDSPAVALLERAGFVRADDVLDTWFSSALWPHSTLGWPEATAELARFYPTSVLITSRDIITLWVARMVLMGLNNVGEVPFRDVFIHPKILDGFGETMS